ncbi:unnamed protein product [Soboliphyme baturini]|uniref:Mitochondrial import inner membrane translocase subunit n=1 Tax=Soboliphyme baturini TaxID=241478 RepID=A0A183J500_9BILA|nr:unnamed protein product [Soboliphyme baturini]
MDSLGDSGSEHKIDPQLASFIEEESQRQQFQVLVHTLTNSCWDVCIGERVGPKMDGKASTCMTNCVNRFIDATNFIAKRLEEHNKQMQ